jgi:GNAT superfamily N-acetyltransferase
MAWRPDSDIASRPTQTREHLVAAEAIERADWREAYRSATPEVAAAFGMRCDPIGGGDVLQMTNLDMPMFNRVLGIGVEEPATEEQLDRAIERFHSAKVPRFFIEVSPTARPISIHDWIGERGLSLFNNWVKLTRDVNPVPQGFTTARIVEVTPDRAADFAHVVQIVFGLPEGLTAWASGLVGRPNRRQFLALEHEKPVGVAALYFEGPWAEFGYAAVLPEARGKGIQAALIAARLRAARDLGCRWISMETAEETLEKPSYSLRNARKMGFEVAYLRPNYLGTSPPS